MIRKKEGRDPRKGSIYVATALKQERGDNSHLKQAHLDRLRGEIEGYFIVTADYPSDQLDLRSVHDVQLRVAFQRDIYLERRRIRTQMYTLSQGAQMNCLPLKFIVR